MDTERFKIEMLDYYNSSQGMVYRINIYNKKNNESWDIERSFKDFEQVDQLFQYRYPNIPKLPSRGWWWQKNKEFYENRFHNLKEYLYSVLESDFSIENMVLAYFLDLNLVVSDAGTAANTSIEELDVDVLEYFKAKLLNIANANERSLAPMERKAREKQYHSFLGNTQYFSEFYDVEMISNNLRLHQSSLSPDENKSLPNSILDCDNMENLEPKLKQISTQDKEIVSMMGRICKEISVSLESKIKPFEIKELKLNFQPINKL
ncbi:PX domain containing protein [Cryptosporidium tyzzeri]|nr:PX domain containing protein [Cryptosporidium tyzzeri]